MPITALENPPLDQGSNQQIQCIPVGAWLTTIAWIGWNGTQNQHQVAWQHDLAEPIALTVAIWPTSFVETRPISAALSMP